MVLGLTAVAYLSGGSLLKALLMGVFGLAISGTRLVLVGGRVGSHGVNDVWASRDSAAAAWAWPWCATSRRPTAAA